MSSISPVSSSPTPVEFSTSPGGAGGAALATPPTASGQGAAGDQVSLASAHSSTSSISQSDAGFASMDFSLSAKQFIEMALALLLLKAMEGEESGDQKGGMLEAVMGLAALGAAMGGTPAGDAFMSSTTSVQSSYQTYDEQGSMNASQSGNTMDVMA